MSGWIAISRDIFGHPMFKDDPMSEREAWIWMLSRAAWKDTRHRVGADMITVRRGAFFCTLRELRDRFGWKSDKRVRTFLTRLQNERMIDVRTDAPKTHVTICNYDEYQGDGRAKDAGGTHPNMQPERGKEEETIQQVPVAKATEAAILGAYEASLPKKLFDQGVSHLVAHGVQEVHARRVIGKWRKNHPDATILAALMECEAAGAVDPISWISNKLTPSKSNTWDFIPDQAEARP